MAMIWRSRITWVWAMLIAATFLSFETMALGNAFLLLTKRRLLFCTLSFVVTWL